MPYLSKIVLNPLRRQAQILLRNPRKLHAAVLAGIAQQPVTERVLWRVEQRVHAIDVLALTQSKPAWHHLVEQAGWPNTDDGAPLIAEYEPIMRLISKGREFAFRLRANPVVSTRQISKPTPSQAKVLESGELHRGVRLGHRTAEHQLLWFLKRAAGENTQWGFSVGAFETATVALVARERVQIKKRNETLVVLETATFEGQLVVTDVDLFTKTVLNGIGSGKAYGCGLLTLAGPRV